MHRVHRHWGSGWTICVSHHSVPSMGVGVNHSRHRQRSAEPIGHEREDQQQAQERCVHRRNIDCAQPPKVSSRCVLERRGSIGEFVAVPTHRVRVRLLIRARRRVRALVFHCQRSRRGAR